MGGEGYMEKYVWEKKQNGMEILGQIVKDQNPSLKALNFTWAGGPLKNFE